MPDPFDPPREASLQGVNADGAESGQQGPWQFGKDVVAVHDVTWPRRCVRCNDAVAPDAEPARLTVGWLPWWTYFFIPLGLIPFLVIYASYRQRLSVEVFVCPNHRRRENRKSLVVALLLFGLVFGGIVMGARAGSPWCWLSGLGVLGFVVVPKDVLWASYVHGEVGRLRGAGQPFLASLAPFDEAKAMAAGLAAPGETLIDPDLLD